MELPLSRNEEIFFFKVFGRNIKEIQDLRNEGELRKMKEVEELALIFSRRFTWTLGVSREGFKICKD